MVEMRFKAESFTSNIMLLKKMKERKKKPRPWTGMFNFIANIEHANLYLIS